jgi:hypothetical protein
MTVFYYYNYLGRCPKVVLQLLAGPTRALTKVVCARPKRYLAESLGSTLMQWTRSAPAGSGTYTPTTLTRFPRRLSGPPKGLAISSSNKSRVHSPRSSTSKYRGPPFQTTWNQPDLDTSGAATLDLEAAITGTTGVRRGCVGVSFRCATVPGCANARGIERESALKNATMPTSEIAVNLNPTGRQRPRPTNTTPTRLAVLALIFGRTRLQPSRRPIKS